MVAFLRRLPELDKAAYDALVHGSAGASRSIAAPGEQETGARVRMETTAAAAGCPRCHGSDDRGRAAFTRLAGHSAARTEERRVGAECVITGSTRQQPIHK